MYSVCQLHSKALLLHYLLPFCSVICALWIMNTLDSSFFFFFSLVKGQSVYELSCLIDSVLASWNLPESQVCFLIKITGKIHPKILGYESCMPMPFYCLVVYSLIPVDNWLNLSDTVTRCWLYAQCTARCNGVWQSIFLVFQTSTVNVGFVVSPSESDWKG